MHRFLLVALSGWLLLGACGGGGSSSSNNTPANPPGGNNPPPADPFGLTQRPSVAALNLPQQGTGLGSFAMTNAYPNLSFTNPLFFAGVPGENRVVVVEQGGTIEVFDDDAATNNSDVIFNISARIVSSGEQGLLGLAFDPNFTQNRYIYVHYSMNSPRRSVIARFMWDAASDDVDLGTEKIIIEIPQPFANHNGGMVAFGPDNYLYIAMGDGGDAGDPQNHGQDTTTLLGNILRLDVHPQNANDPYDIPADNPFVGQSGFREEIYALGLRNPYRFSFDRQNGTLWAADVGQDAIEEIDIIESGGNYGWRVFEGTQSFDGSQNSLPNSAFTPPVHEYPHSQGFSVTGGYVYRGSRLASLFGRYLFADFGSSRVWALEWDGAQVTSVDQIGTVSSPSSFGEKNDGEVLIVSRGGEIFQIDPSGGNGGQIPDLLSDTGLFTDLGNLTPASGLIEYSINHPFFSEYTNKRRWFAVPDNQTIDFSADDWTFPLGSVIVKHFEIELEEGNAASARRLETRVLINTDQGWLGFTYRWNAGQTDADLLASRETEDLTVTLAGGGTRQQTYEYPSRTDCLACHTDVAGFTLGLKTVQLNADFDYSGVTDNQLRSLNNIQMFDTDIGAADQYGVLPALDDATASIQDRARAYLDVNCSQCHQPNGPTASDLDLRNATANAGMNAIGASPLFGDLGLNNAEIVAAGEKERSILWERVRRLDNTRMPPLSHNVVDDEAVDVIGQWIDAL